MLAAAFSVLVFIGVSGVVGIRLLMLWRRTRGTPELACGLALTCIGMIGYPVAMASGMGIKPVGQVNIPLFVTGTFFANFGVASYFWFTWKTFRQDVAWARWLTFTAIGLLAVAGAAGVRDIAAAPPEMPSIEAQAGPAAMLLLVTSICFLWAGIEGWRQYGMARRRLAIGLGDEVTTNRFLLWTGFAAANLILTWTYLFAQVLGLQPATNPAVQGIVGALVCVVSVCVYLAFLPPKAYLARIRGRVASA